MIPDNQTVTIERVAGRDKYKNPTGTHKYPLRANVLNEIARVTNSAGEEVVTSLTVKIRTAALQASGAGQLLYSDKLTFADEFGNVTSRVPQSIAPARGFSGKSPFVRVFL